MVNRTLLIRSSIALVCALVVIVAVVTTARYMILKHSAQTPPTARPAGTVSEEVLRSITPPKDAKPAIIDQAVLDSLTPPEKR